MNKIYSVIAATAFATIAMQAETVENYVQDFEAACQINDKTYSLPGSWGHLAEGFAGDNSTYFPTYTYKTSGGLNNSKCIQVSDQANVGSYNDGWGASYDLLITPEVSGTISIDYKKQNSYASGCFIEFYYLVPDGDSFTRGELIEVEMPELTNTDFTTISFSLPTPQRIGIRASYGFIDHFTASKAEVEKKRALAIKSANNISVGNSSPICDANNRFTLKAHIKLENTGEADILTSDPDATITMCWASDYKGADAQALKTVSITQDIPVGETIEMDIEAEVDGNLYPDRAPYGVRENITGSYEYFGWITPNLYKPQFQLLRTDGTRVSDDDIKNGKFAFDYGRVTQTTVKNYSVKNAGSGPLVVNSIDAPEGISVSPDNFTVAYNETLPITITLSGDNFATIDDNITLNIDGIDPISIPVIACVLDPTKYYVNFEDGTFPSDMIVVGPRSSSRWSIETFTSSSKDKPANNCWAKNGADAVENHDRLITPLLHFNEGEQISMDLFKLSDSGSCTSQVTILYSDDRANWTEAGSIQAADMANPTGSYTKTYMVTPYAVNIPAGNHYVAIECNYVAIDDIYGGKPVVVNADLYPTSAKAPANGMVNYDYNATVNILNLMNEDVVAEVDLMVNGEVMASQEVDVKAFAKDTQASLSFLANQELENAIAYFVVKAEGCEFKSNIWLLTIEPEKMIAESEIIAEQTRTMSQVPFFTNWYRTQSEIIYPAETIDLNAGDVITSMSFKGYRTNADVKTLKMKVWIENCDASAPDINAPADTETMLQVADEYEITLTPKGDSDACVNLFDISFSEPFTYNGGNIRIATQTLLDEYCNGTNFEVGSDESLSANAMYRNDDKREFGEEITKSWTKSNAPIVVFGIQAEPAQISGTVRSESGSLSQPLAGATVILSAIADENAPEGARTVTYSAVSDENGNYSIPVMQTALSYNLSAKAPYHYDYTHPEVIEPADGNKAVNFNMLFDVSTSVNTITSQPALPQGAIFNMQGVYLGEDASHLAPGIYIINGQKTVIK